MENITIFEEIKATKGSLANQLNSLMSLAEQLENKYKEIKEREAKVEVREKEVIAKEQRIAERERECEEKEKGMEATSLFETNGKGKGSPSSAAPHHLTTIDHSLQTTLLENVAFGDKILEWLPNKQFHLLYKATLNGFGASDFHKNCDNKGSTLTIIHSKDGYLFGGYSVLPWDTTSYFKQHSEGFIFTLSNPHKLPPTKYARNKEPNATYCFPSYGPTFGFGHDIYVASNSNHANTNSFTKFGVSYCDTTGFGNETFTGAYGFLTSDIEVFAVL